MGPILVLVELLHGAEYVFAQLPHDRMSLGISRVVGTTPKSRRDEGLSRRADRYLTAATTQMTVAVRVIATMLLDPARGVIKGRQFQHDRVVGEPIQWARVMAQLREVDELVIFDVTHNLPDLELIKRIAAECNIPVAYGGGIQDVPMALQIIKSIADKVVFEPKDYAIAAEAANRAGAQAVVMCLNSPGLYVGMGGIYGEVLIQSPDHDGMMNGYDLEGIRMTRMWFDGPIIASSGAGMPQDCVEAVKAGADAVAAGAMYQFLEITPNDVKRALADAGYPVRLMVPA